VSNNRSIAKERSNDRNGGLSDYNHVIELDPNFAEAFNNGGSLRKLMGELRAALKDIELGCPVGAAQVARINGV